MGKVMTKLKITNNTDLTNARLGQIQNEVRSVEVEALVDTGATMLALPAEVVRQLGVPFEGKRKVRDALGKIIELYWVAGLRIEILGREMTCDALVLDEGATPLIGQIPLEALDLVVDPKSREARVNPASPDVPLLDLMAVA
jgi:clan AA aspartic protease